MKDRNEMKYPSSVYLSVLINLKVGKLERGLCMYNIFKGSCIRVEVKYIPSLPRSSEEKNTRILSFGIQNNDEAIIKLIFMAFVIVIVNA